MPSNLGDGLDVTPALADFVSRATESLIEERRAQWGLALWFVGVVAVCNGGAALVAFILSGRGL